MGKIPERLKIATWYRSIFHKIEKKLWIPRINPSVYQVAAIVLSFAVLFADEKLTKFLLVGVILILDWFDGATARKYKMTGEVGYMIDVVVDKLSEFIMFFPLHGSLSETVWFSLAMVNLILSYIGFSTGKHTIMALRFFYLFYIWI